ncbi:putative Transcriptional regulator, MarR family [Candidatus Zixiibacteriota bacterium]|nr:putative Transcriptional regulator, MarR family [candidate division Zixibacteria bacterium]
MTDRAQKRASGVRKEIAEIVSYLRHIKGVNQTQAQELMKKYGITAEQLGALRLVAASDEITLGKLSGLMYLHISTCSGIVDRLEKRKYLKRERSREDRRVVHLRITPLGISVIKKTPLSGIGRLMRDIEKLPAKDILKIRDAMFILSQVMDIEKIK